MKTSTSRDSNVKHSTGKNDTAARKDGRGRGRPRTSTGEQAAVKHVTGRLFDVKQEEQRQAKTRAKRAADNVPSGRKPSQAA